MARVRGGRLRVSVQDRGGGIPEEFRAKVFEKFAQADSSDVRQKEGAGLGLAIAKALVEAMGGTIGFNANPDMGTGTTFYIELPEAT
jgi:signal transduction histidine kinase